MITLLKSSIWYKELKAIFFDYDFARTLFIYITKEFEYVFVENIGVEHVVEIKKVTSTPQIIISGLGI